MADKVLCTKTNQNISLVSEIANSGEGKVWRTDRDGYLAKIYHDPTPERIQKLEVMIAHPPTDHQASKGHVSYAWATSILKNMQGESIGFLMPEIKQGRELIEVYNPKLRRQKELEVDWRFLHATAFNIALFIRDIHQAGYVIGDIKPQNILVNPSALPSIIDTDSFQVRNPKTGEIYRCLVGSEGFTPPELLSQDLALTDQTEVHDRFRLGVIIHLLLFGSEPFQGKWTGAGDSPAPDELLKRGWWAYGQNSLIEPSRSTIPLEVVHPEIKRLFLKCFNDGHKTPSMRPSADEWRRGLETAIQGLTVCAKVDTHFLYRGNTCYWCHRKIDLGLDIFEIQRTTPISTNTKVNVVSNQNDIFSVDDISELVKQEGRRITVIGKIDHAVRIKKTLYINFQTDLGKNIIGYSSFYCVMFASTFEKYENTSIITTLQNSQGKFIAVSGLLKIYEKKKEKRPQIILNELNQYRFLSQTEAINLLKNPRNPTNQKQATQQTQVISTPTPIPNSPVTLNQNPPQPSTQISNTNQPSGVGKFFLGGWKYFMGFLTTAVIGIGLILYLNRKYADEYYNRASANYAQNDYNGAISGYTEAIRIDPNYIAAYFNRASAKSNLGDYHGAIDDYTEVIRLNPNSEYAYSNRASTKSNLGDYHGAIDDYTEFIRLDLNNEYAYFDRGNAKFNLGDKQGAISDYTEVIRLYPNFAGAYNSRGTAKSYLEDNEGAIEDFQDAARIYQQEGKTSDYENTQNRIKKLGG